MSCSITPIETPPGHDLTPCEDFLIMPEDLFWKIVDKAVYNIEREEEGTHKIEGFLETIEAVKNDHTTH